MILSAFQGRARSALAAALPSGTPTAASAAWRSRSGEDRLGNSRRVGDRCTAGGRHALQPAPFGTTGTYWRRRVTAATDGPGLAAIGVAGSGLVVATWEPTAGRADAGEGLEPPTRGL